MTAFPSLRRLNVSDTLVHVIYWALFAVFAGYQTSLLLGRGFTSGEAGVFASIRCFAGILAQPLLEGLVGVGIDPMVFHLFQGGSGFDLFF